MTVLRPLIGSNKSDIIQLSRHIGTEKISAKVQEYCALNRKNPATSARSVIIAQEESLISSELLHDIVLNAHRLDIKSTGIESDEGELNSTTTIPRGVVIVDVRPKKMFLNWHLEEALWLEWNQALDGYKTFSREKRYLICCEYGLLSRHLVKQMNKVGLDACHLAGGISTYRKELDRSKKVQ